jgi:antirestriction protein ArdC
MSVGISANTYSSITNRIVAALSAGVLPWRRPWRSRLPCNAISGEAYRGINSLVLSLSSMEREFESNQWLTYRQAQLLGGHVRNASGDGKKPGETSRPRRKARPNRDGGI